MKFFFDHNLGRQLAEGMRGFGEDAIHLTELFAPDAPDVVWLEYVGKHALLLVTRDERVRWHPAELAAIRAHRVGTFFLGGKGRSRCELIRQVVRHWHRMKKLGAKTKRPFAFRIPPTGTKITRIDLP